MSGSTLCLWFHLMSLSLIPCFLVLFPVVWWLWGKLYNEVSFNLVGVELFAVFSYSLAPDRLPHVCMRHHDYVIGCNVCVRGASVLAPLSLREETPNNTETSVYFVPWSDGLSSQWISCEHLWRCQSSLFYLRSWSCAMQQIDLEFLTIQHLEWQDMDFLTRWVHIFGMVLYHEI